MVIPAALLRRFYVGGSLQNAEQGGFGFRLKNTVAPTTIVSLGPIEIDNEPYAASQVTLTASKSRLASTVSDQTPLHLKMGKEIALHIDAEALTPGEHEVTVHAMTKEVGPVIIAVTETI